MPNLPIRDLGSVGVITDVDPFNLPINAFTRAKNVRFDQGNIRRSPGFRDVSTLAYDWPLDGAYYAIQTAFGQAILDTNPGLGLFRSTSDDWAMAIPGRMLGDITDSGDLGQLDQAAMSQYLDWKVNGNARNVALVDDYVSYIDLI